MNQFTFERATGVIRRNRGCNGEAWVRDVTFVEFKGIRNRLKVVRWCLYAEMFKNEVK